MTKKRRRKKNRCYGKVFRSKKLIQLQLEGKDNTDYGW